MERRVVITSEAVISPIGDSEKKILESFENGVSGVSELDNDGVLYEFLASKVFGKITYDLDFKFDRKYAKTMGPVGYYACLAAQKAILAAGLDPEFMSSGRMGVSFGSTQGSPTIQRDIFKVFLSRDKSQYIRMNPAGYLQSMTHTTAANIAKLFQITGRVICSCTACTTSSQSIGFAYESIKYGLQDAMVCGGADEYDTTTVAVFDRMLAASHSYNDRPHLTPRPFDKNRDGLVIGEGAGAVVLEEYEFAKKRGAPILAEVIGFACSNNGGDLVHPNRQGIVQTITTGLDNAGITPEAVDFVSAHGTATRVGDIVEAQAMHDVYGANPLVTAFKSYVGHTMGTCGVMETVFTLYLMKNKMMVPTLNLEDVDDECAMINHTPSLGKADIKIATIQNFAFGGVNTALFIKKIE